MDWHMFSDFQVCGAQTIEQSFVEELHPHHVELQISDLENNQQLQTC